VTTNTSIVFSLVNNDPVAVYHCFSRLLAGLRPGHVLLTPPGDMIQSSRESLGCNHGSADECQRKVVNRGNEVESFIYTALLTVSQQLYSDNRRLEEQRLFKLYSRSRIKLLSR